MAGKSTTTNSKKTTSPRRRAVKTAGKGLTQKAQRPSRDPGSKKTSALGAAARVLEETGKAMSCPELIEVMAAKHYWKSPGGKTPAATLYSAILRELKQEGTKARFKKTGPGKFARA